MNVQQKRKILWTIVLIAYLLTWLPNLGILNSLTWVGPIPLPLAWVLLMNVILTICVIMVYLLHYKPFFKQLEQMPIQAEEVK